MIKNPVLIETHELAALSLNDVRIIETDLTSEHFEKGHIPGSLFWPVQELMTPEFQIRTDPHHFASLLSHSGISPETFVVCSFGGQPEMAAWGTWLFWILTEFGHANVAVLNGGTFKWAAEGRPLSAIESELEPTSYPVPEGFGGVARVMKEQVSNALEADAVLVDARSEAEYSGEHYFNAPPQDGEVAGHIPGAIHLPHHGFLNENGTFVSAERIRDAVRSANVPEDADIIAYCTVGIRSTLNWFVLKHLLGLKKVWNYDGSWAEWSRITTAVATGR